jgi:methionyl-tRNA formyltransferase
MNIIFFGSSQFAVSSLKALSASGQKISCVVTQPDRPKGRGLALAPTPISRLAGELGLKIYQPKQINNDEVINFLKTLSADLFIVIAYGQILSQEILDIPKIFALNVHASLLPKYRGAAPINWAIIKGEKTSGITIIKMVKEMDAGPIILQESIKIDAEDTAITLEDKLSSQAAKLLLDSLILVEKNNYNLSLQDEDKVSFAAKLKKEDGRINWNESSNEIYNLIRGCIPWPGAFTYYQGKLLKIYKAKVIRLSGYQVIRRPGEIIEVSHEGITVVTGEGSLIIEELQIEGKRRMKSEEFIAGHKINIGEMLGKK